MKYECENTFEYLSVTLLLRNDDRNYTAKEQDFCREISIQLMEKDNSKIKENVLKHTNIQKKMTLCL